MRTEMEFRMEIALLTRQILRLETRAETLRDRGNTADADRVQIFIDNRVNDIHRLESEVIHAMTRPNGEWR